MILLLVACHHKAPEPAPPLVAPEAEPGVVRASTGTLRDGVWTDSLYPFSVVVPPGWTTAPGGPDEARVRFTDPATGVQVAVHARPSGDLAPHAHEGCVWDFVDTARYRVLHVPGAITVATCTPSTPDAPRLLGWYFGDSDTAWHVEATVPNGVLAPGKEHVELLLGTVRLR